MILLAIDTSAPRAVVAVSREEGTVVSTVSDPERKQGRELLPVVRDLLVRAGVEPKEIEAVVVGLGPGSFTGTRVGVTAAKMLAYAASARLIGLDSLEVMARSCQVMAEHVIAIADAQRGEFFAAEFARKGLNSSLLRLGPTSVMTRTELLERIGTETVLLGPATEKSGLLAEADRKMHELPVEFGHPEVLLDLGREALASGRSDDMFFLEPIYLRRSAAEDLWTARRSISQTP